MRTGGMRHALYCAGILLTLVGFHGFVSAVQADNVKGMLDQINKELRQAQKDMFGGMTEKAIASLEQIQEKIINVNKDDPNNPRLKSYENRYRKLVKDLERRTGRDLGGGTLTAAGGSPKTELPHKSNTERVTAKDLHQKVEIVQPENKTTDGNAELPSQAKELIRKAMRDLDQFEHYSQKLNDPKWNQGQLIRNMKIALESARKNFESGKANAAEKGVASHPDFDEAGRRIAESEVKISQAEKDYEKSKEEASAEASEVTADVKALKAEYDRVKVVFEMATGSIIHYNDLKTVKELLDRIENFEKNDLTRIIQKKEAFGRKYGTTRDEIDRRAGAMGYTDNYYSASFAYTELAEGIENVKKTRTVMADDLIRKAEEMKTRMSRGIHDFARIQQQTRVMNRGRMAADFDRSNPRVKEFNAGIDAWLEEDRKALNAKVDNATWPQLAGDAPADAGRLAREVKEFLQKEEDERAARGKEAGKIIAVIVTGPWSVFKKNILAEPIQYNLPIACAVQIESERPLNLVRVYLMTMLTRELKGVKTAPPFIGATVGDSYYIRPSAVK